MVLATDARLVRPFPGTGVLGGCTTFSAYVVETQQLVQAGATRTALARLATRGRASRYALLNITGGIIAGLGAAYLGTVVAEAFTAGIVGGWF